MTTTTLKIIVSGQSYDFSDLVRTYESFDRVCSEDFRHAVSTRSLTLVYTPQLLSLLSQNNVLVEIDLNGARDFTGRLAPSSLQTRSYGAALSGADIEDLSVEFEDNTFRLERQLSSADGLVIENAIVCDASQPGKSSVHWLLSLAGLEAINPPNIATALLAFAPDPGQTILDILDTLLYEYGYTFTFDPYGRVKIIKIIYDNPTPELTLAEHDIKAPLEIEKLYSEYDSVEVSYYPLKYKERVLLYMADLPFGDNGLRSGWPIQPGYLWPEEANVQETWFEYTDKAIGSKLDLKGNIVVNKDFTSIVMTKNHAVEEKTDPGVQKILQQFENKRCRLAYKNNSDYPKNVYYCNVYGNVTYRGAKTIISESEQDLKPYKYDAEYVHDNQTARSLYAFIKTKLKAQCWRFKFKSDENLLVGTVVKINDPYAEIYPVLLLTEKTFNSETNEYSYKCIGLSAPTIGTFVESASQGLEPPSYAQNEETAISSAKIEVSKEAFSVLSDWNGNVKDWNDLEFTFYVKVNNADDTQNWNIIIASTGVLYDLIEKKVVIISLTDFVGKIEIIAQYKYTNTLSPYYKRFGEVKFGEGKFYTPYHLYKAVNFTKVAPIDRLEFKDVLNRTIAVNPQKGLLVLDTQGKIIHDIPDQQVADGEYYMGHMIWWQDPGVTLFNGAVQADQWYTVNIAKRSYTNIKGVILDIYESYNPDALVAYASTRVAFRPYGSNLGIDECFTPYVSMQFNANSIDYLRSSMMIIIPVGFNLGNLSFQFYPGVALGLLYIGQRGILI
ncbi:hypothetical protein [Gracilinema caldarium]|uniref:hypothetical protein n=1 Tax=Gracilinema caldarium TaxID=215591 RepID=UPI0026F273BA|nr:hypothetical protein [Gracilinema caldarium]